MYFRRATIMDYTSLRPSKGFCRAIFPMKSQPWRIHTQEKSANAASCMLKASLLQPVRAS